MIFLRIITGFDGAAPFSDAGVSKKDDGTFEVRPSWRPETGISEEALGCGSRFSIKVENSSNQNQLFRCRINWQDKVQRRLRFHDYIMVLFPESNEWKMHPCTLNHSCASLKITIPPGITHIGASPWYGYQTAIEYLESKKDFPEVKYFSAGKSEESKDIPVLVIGSKGQDVLIMARNHAYESSGSFCIEGMINYLLINSAEYKNKYRFHFMPMTNPDGVFNGMSRLTAPNGADLNRCIEQDDSAWRAIKTYIDKIKPSYLLNIHNWMDKEEDGILANTERMAREFEQQMPDVTEDGHFWKLEWLELYLENCNLTECPRDCESWKDYVKKKFKTTALTLEYPWYNRTTERMRQIGKQSLIAFLNSGDDFSKGEIF